MTDILAAAIRPGRCRGHVFAGMLAIALSGCTTFSADRGLGEVQALSREHVTVPLTFPDEQADPALAGDATERMLSQPLSVEAAIQVAVLNNRGIRASLASLGIAESDVVEAGRLSNPVFSFGSKRSSEARSIERTVLVNLLSLIVMPIRQDVARRQFEAAQIEVAGDVVRLANETRMAWIDAVAAQESVRYFEQVRMAADAGAELASRMARVGNFSKLAHMREQAFYADATAQLAKAQLAAVVERERLTRLLGLSGPQVRFALPDRLPDLPATPRDPATVERTGLDRRLDVRLAQGSTASLAADLGLVRTTRIVNVLEAGYTNESERGERRKDGYEIEVSIPLFDWGDAKLVRAEAMYMQSVHRTAQVALAAQSELRERYQAYRTAYDIARHYRDEIVPLRKRISEENTLRYNGMLIGVFELLADARDQVASVNGYLEALREFWRAHAELELAIAGASRNREARPRGSAMPASSAAAAH